MGKNISYEEKATHPDTIRVRPAITVDAATLIYVYGYHPDQVARMDPIRRVQALRPGQSRLIAFCRDGSLAAPSDFGYRAAAEASNIAARLMWPPDKIIPIEEVQSMDEVTGVIIAYARKIFLEKKIAVPEARMLTRGLHREEAEALIASSRTSLSNLPGLPKGLWNGPLPESLHGKIDLLDAETLFEVPTLQQFWLKEPELAPLKCRREKRLRALRQPMRVPEEAYAQYAAAKSPIGVVNCIVNLATKALEAQNSRMASMPPQEREHHARSLICGIDADAISMLASF